MALFIKPHGKTGSERFFRMIGMVIILGLVIYAFWMNNQSTLEKIQARNALWDQTKILDRSERDYIQGFIRSMRNEFGVKVRIQIILDPITEQEVDPKELLIVLSPPQQEVGMYFPGLVRHALGNEFISELENKHFENHFADEEWPASLMTSLSMIWERLVNVESKQPVPEVHAEENDSQPDPESSAHEE
ncbi:TPM domain-containing protein [Desulfovibrio sp. JC022]|uniref:TPM domain-containing protein n=1 Tax=Desulfovibrio sp. JC022 TaxID=2593642 RepID=UPI0013CF522B|nr:TPM domain-containing protein [Desulfovibrio sp. JC022]NDV23921.1 TPM domain-containing protein [Desulfovibrio sp. JC022]